MYIIAIKFDHDLAIINPCIIPIDPSFSVFFTIILHLSEKRSWPQRPWRLGGMSLPFVVLLPWHGYDVGLYMANHLKHVDVCRLWV